MVFKSFRLMIIVRIVLLTATLALTAGCIAGGLYLRSIYAGVAACVMAIELMWYIDRFNRDVKTFMISLQQRDFTTHFQTQDKSGSSREMYAVLNTISAAFRKISIEKEVQHRYLSMLFEHVQVGILSVDSSGVVRHANQALHALFQMQVITSVRSFDIFGEPLSHAIRDIHTGETRLIRLQTKQELLQIAMHASEFKLEDTYYKLISMQNIRAELDVHEMDAWQKLIRVLSHEIMNSVAPIMSLSATLHDLVKNNPSASDTSLHQTLDAGLDAIRNRSEGLYNFTQTYRKLTHVPTLQSQQINLSDLLRRVEVLMLPKMLEQRIRFAVTTVDFNMSIDVALMEQVLINLLLNAIDAVDKKADGYISLRAALSGTQPMIIITDNGPGIPDEIIDKIFIPFFTTKAQGSGIGLAITRQIIQLHQADIIVQSFQGAGTEFIIQWR